MKRKTTITLTIAALLGLAGVLYGGATFFSPDRDPQGQTGPIGVAASQTGLFATDYCTATGVPLRNINSIDCQGNATLLAQIPTTPGCEEMYMAIAPLQSLAAGFVPRDIFITHGPMIYQLRPPAPITLFATIPDPGCSPDHTGITFDHTGPPGIFGNKMILTCIDGSVWTVDGTGQPSVTNIANVTFNGQGLEIEGPAVVPLSFGGPHAGQLWVANENYPGVAPPGALHTIGPPPTYTVTLNVVSYNGAESVQVIPDTLCRFCPPTGGVHFQAITLYNFGQGPGIYQYVPLDFATLGGQLLVTSENGIGTSSVKFDVPTQTYVTSFFDNLAGAAFEGSTFVDCDVPSPTPTPSPTATATATATFTPTPTATATATATATSTPTPTPTVTPTTCGTAFVIGDLDAVVGNHVTFWGAQWWRLNHLSGGTAPASFKGFANCTNPNPPTCGGTWISDPGNSSHPPATVPADMTVIVSSLITKSGQIESGNIPMMVTIHTDPGYEPNPGHAGTGTVTAVVCQGARPQHRPAPRPR